MFFKDILDALLAAQKEIPDLLDEDLLAQAIVLLTAVHVNTSTSIAIITYFIAKHKAVQEKLQEQIDAIMSDDSRDGEDKFPTWDDIGKLSYLDQVISESLRLYPAGNLKKTIK